MTVPKAAKFCDRRTGKMVSQSLHAERFLDWSYNTPSGQRATALLFSRKFVSVAYGWLHKLPWSRRKIVPFIARLEVDVSEALRAPDEFTSFNDFFTREIDLSRRPINPDPAVCVAPCDGRLLAYPVIKAGCSFPIKGSLFNLDSFLDDDELATRFSGGALAISRLYLSDYHHFHFPDSGMPGVARRIAGRYFAVGPYALCRPISFYTENVRTLTMFRSDHFGIVAMVEVGAFTVGSIRQRYCPGGRVAKGDRKGFFEVGGSTVVLLFEKGAIKLDEDLCDNTRSDLETYVRLGESIGTLPSDRHQ